MIDVMQGDKFGFAVIATPYTAAATDEHFSYAKQAGDSVQHTESAGRGSGNSNYLTRASSVTESETYSVNAQIETESKAAVDWLNYIDKVLMPRLDHGHGGQ